MQYDKTLLNLSCKTPVNPSTCSRANSMSIEKIGVFPLVLSLSEHDMGFAGQAVISILFHKKAYFCYTRFVT